jgi:6-phosphogluconolactonase
MILDIYDTPEQLAVAAGEAFVQAATQAIAARGRFEAMLSGGTTPRAVYRWLAAHRELVDWSRVSLSFGDERSVPPDHADSNYRMAREALLDALDGTGVDVLRIAGELPPHEAAAQYEANVRSRFPSGPPRFDLVFLGLGDDAHTASLFPGTAVIYERDAWFVAHDVEGKGWRITATPPLINAARQVVFLVSGKGKARAVWNVLRGGRDLDRYPAQVIEPASGNLRWLLDSDAARFVASSE